MYQVVLCTCPDIELAKDIAQQLVKKKLAACVNIINQVTSVYQWQGEVNCDAEVQLMIKTTTDKFNDVSHEIKRIHRYDTPEIIALNIQQGDKDYLNWITESVKE